MKKYIALILMLVSCACFSQDYRTNREKGIPLSDDWVLVSGTDDFRSFVNKRTIKIRGSIRDAWILNDYKKTQPFNNGKAILKYKSDKNLIQFMCNSREMTSTSTTAYAGSYGSGKVIASYNNYHRSSVIPDTVGEAYYEYVCSQ